MKPHSFCETPKENCTMNHCDENGCLNRKRELVELMLKSSDHNPYTGMLSKKDNLTMTNEQLIIYQAAKIAELEQNLIKVQERCDQFQKWWYELKTKEAQVKTKEAQDGK